MVKSIRVTGDGSPHPIAASGLAHWVAFKADKSNSSDVFVGTAAGQTLPISPGDWFCFWPCMAADVVSYAHLYVLSDSCYLAQPGDVLHIVYMFG